MKVMVAVENDQLAKLTLASLAQRTWPADTEFILVHVIESESYNYKGSLESWKHKIALDSEDDREHQKQHAWLCDLVSASKASFGDMRFIMVTGQVSYCLKQFSNVSKPAFIVMASHERSAKQRLWLESISASLVDELDCSLEVIKPFKMLNQTVDHKQPASWLPKRILVPVDGSENSVKALNWLIDQELPGAVDVKLVMVLEDNRYSELNDSRSLHSVYSGKRWSTKYNFRQQAREWFDETLLNTKRYLKNNQVDGACLQGDVSAGIITVADEWNADLIVIGSHGEKGLCVDGIKKTSGSTSRNLVENAHQNIIVINSNAEVLPSFKWNEDSNYSLAAELGKVSK